MNREPFSSDVVAGIAAAAFPDASLVGFVPLRGGLEAAVARLTVRGADRKQQSVILKRLPQSAQREASFYSRFAPLGAAPALLGAVQRDDTTWLLLEQVRPISNWPWRDSLKTRLVLDLLARVHAAGGDALPADAWDYEEELRRSAGETLAVAADLLPRLGEPGLLPGLRPLSRVCAALPVLRERMAAAAGMTLIHGDVHTGNVMVRRTTDGENAVLLDWGRSRVGSPLEDVSSWLLSLRSWEPATARDHDSLFRAYLVSAGLRPELTPELRAGYWFAAASNVLSGALRYHLVVAAESGGKRRATAVAQARAALRVIRRADERLREQRR